MADRTLRTLCCAEWLLSVYMATWDFLWRACKNAEEIRKKGHIFGVYLEKCTWGDTYSLQCPISLNSLGHRSVGCPTAVF